MPNKKQRSRGQKSKYAKPYIEETGDMPPKPRGVKVKRSSVKVKRKY